MMDKYTPAAPEELAEEARKWDAGEVTPEGWADAPHAIPSLGRVGMANEEQLKERACFYIDRQIAALETEAADHEKMAKDGVPYSDRKRVEAAATEHAEKNKHELEAMQWARGKLMEV